ncbi:MAG: hypothetical protein ABSC10_04210 [Candidatus Acidiferrales bacterium]|jgi:hypothetical protein
MNLRSVIDKYLAVAGAYGKSVPLQSLGLSREETEHIFDVLDEDYHISRFFHFSKAAGQSFQISGFAQTHISIDSEIQEIL